MRKVVLLGASGSIGKQTIEIINEHLDEIVIEAVSVGNNIEYLSELLKTYPIKRAYSITKDEKLAAEFKDIEFFAGEDGLCEMLEGLKYDLLINALVGFVGLRPTLKAIEDGIDVALANKETLVASGDIVMKKAKEKDVKIIPIDSEHSAIFQALQGSKREDVKSLIVTGSGGAFRDLPLEALKNVSKKDALKHPVWDMGAKITIDSATMMNKGYEIIEAHHLFDMPYEKIDVIIHYESIVHSAVEYADGSIIAQLSNPDMRLPIEYALFYPRHLKRNSYSHLDLAKLQKLSFKEVDYDRYKLIKAAILAGKMGGNMGAVLNGANDTAVALFLKDKITFLDIEKVVIKALSAAKYIKEPTLDEIFASNIWAQNYVKKYFNAL